MRLSYSLENIRCLKSTPEIEIRPITILIGRNSAGKSTFLRSFPLIRQSIETRSSAPILWFGDLVDFGDFDSAVGDYPKGGNLSFEFCADNLSGISGNNYYEYRYYRRRASIEVSKVHLKCVIGARDKKTRLDTLQIKIPSEDVDVSFEFGKGSSRYGNVLVNGDSVSVIDRNFDIGYIGDNIFRTPVFISKARSKSDTGRGRRIRRADEVLSDILISILREALSKQLGWDTIRREVGRVLSSNALDSERLTELRDGAHTKTFKQLYMRLKSKSDFQLKRDIYSIQKLARAFSVLDVFTDRLSDYFLGVDYIEPVRAASERFYRKQELEVSEIAPNGANFPMFLASLPQPQMTRFSNWVEEIFGFGVEVRESGGHIGVHLKQNSRSVNVADMGYGVSQILPVLGTIWWAINKPRRPQPTMRRPSSRTRTLAVEQPELHLHPAHQAKLADVFVSALSENARDNSDQSVGLLIETHSEALINRLGELIEGGKIPHDFVQIVVFSAPEEIGSPTTVSLSSFDDNGVLNNWPFGFFNY